MTTTTKLDQIEFKQASQIANMAAKDTVEALWATTFGQ